MASGSSSASASARAGEHLQWFLRGRDREARARARALGQRQLEREDPRDALAQLAALPGLPVPRRVQYGELALRDLYRDLYGVEAC